MLQDHWCFYEVPTPKRWMFKTRRRSYAPSLFAVMGLLLAIIVAAGIHGS